MPADDFFTQYTNLLQQITMLQKMIEATRVEQAKQLDRIEADIRERLVRIEKDQREQLVGLDERWSGMIAGHDQRLKELEKLPGRFLAGLVVLLLIGMVVIASAWILRAV